MILLILISMFSINVHGQNWFPVGKAGANRGYESQILCQSTEQYFCYDVSNKNVATHKVKQVEVDDLTKPTFEAKSKITVCESEQDCFEKMGDDYCPETHFAIVSEDFTEVYCTKQVGYEKKLEDQLLEDPTLKQNYDNAKAAKAAEKVTRKNKRDTRTTDLKTCVVTLAGNANPSEVKSCLLKLIKEEIRGELDVGDL